MPKLNAASTDSHRYAESSAPATPASGFAQVYIGTDKLAHLVNSAGSNIVIGRNLGAQSELTIASGVVTKTGSVHSIDTQSDASSDDLDTINGGVSGDLLLIRANNDGRTVVVKNGTGNILTFDGEDIDLDEDHKYVTLYYDGTNWNQTGGNSGGMAFNAGASTELTISSGAVTITGKWHTIDTESDGAYDDLVTINGGVAGDVLFIRAENDGRTVGVQNTGNIRTCTGNRVWLTEDHRVMSFIYNGTNWLEIGSNLSIMSTGYPSELTISSGVITKAAGITWYYVDTESMDASDDLDTINGGVDGEIIYLEPANDARTVVVKNGTGNIVLQWSGGDVSLDEANKVISLHFDGAFWREVQSAGGAGGGGGTDSDAIHDNASGEIAAITEKASPVSTDLLLIEDSAASNAKKRVQIGNLPGGGGGADHAYYTYEATVLEPDALEPLQVDTFSYAIGSGETKIVLASWQTRLGAAGRWEVRDPSMWMPLRDVTLTGTASGSSGVILDPTIGIYSDARDTYFDRLNTIATSAAKYLPFTAGSQRKPFLPGPYGAIITSMTLYALTWIVARLGSIGWNLANEIGDGAGDTWRIMNKLYIPVNYKVINGLVTGLGAAGGVTYFLCPANWSTVVDGNTYDFRDDFLGASLDTVSDWTRTQTGTGVMEIDTDYAWLEVNGDGTWGNNGINSQASITRANGKVFECLVYIGDVSEPNLLVGFHDGAGHSFSDMVHGVYFTNSGGLKIQVFEEGNSRGNVGSGYGQYNTFRVRITLDGSGGATYEVQSNNANYAALGSGSWTNITPGTSASTETDLHAGAVIQSNRGNHAYVGDVRIY